MELVEHYLSASADNKKKKQSSSPESLKAELQALLNTPELVELLALEMEAEKLELDMGKALFPFTELSRLLSNKRIYLDEVKGVADLDELPSLRETVRVSVPQAFVSMVLVSCVPSHIFSCIFCWIDFQTATSVHFVPKRWFGNLHRNPTNIVGSASDTARR